MSSTSSNTSSSSRAGSRPPSPPPPQPLPRKLEVSPQKTIDKFWKEFNTKHPGKPFTVLPDNLYAKRAALQAARNPNPSKNAVASYEQAAAMAKAKVEKIARDCRRLNQKYKDPHFDIEFDFMQWQWYGDSATEDCLQGLDGSHEWLRPMSVKRVEDIFEKPQFYIEGMTASDVRQGGDGDCWFLSAICTLSNKDDLLERVCVARDEKVGVYGFVFHRDGEWISEVIDDKLYLSKEDFHENFWIKYDWLSGDKTSADDEYRRVMQTGSKALYFAQCRDQNETWLPLLEKAYAKAHGDYAAISGGWVGEGLEDLTGGVTTELFTADILDKDKFWNDELMNVNKLFLFGLAQMGGVSGERKGIVEQHAYSIMEAREFDNLRLLKVRNPWGQKEWDGAWSDGSEEWTPDRMRRLNHTFGNDGLFWMSYEDLLKHFQHVDRTRLFDADWGVTRHWTSVNVPWSVDYLDTHFKFVLPKSGPVVIALSQLDDRYFRGLVGQYEFQLQFRLHKDGQAEYLARSNPSYFMNRSATVELDLEAGQYCVMVKITATRNKSAKTPADVVRETCEKRRDKLMAVGLSYDLAHAKGGLKENAVEHKERVKKERRDKNKAKAKKIFELDRANEKRSKLRRLRQEAKQKAKNKAKENIGKDDKSKGDPQTVSDSTTGAKVEESTVYKPEESGAAAPGVGTVWSQDLTRKEIKIIIEVTDKTGSGKNADSSKSEIGEKQVTTPPETPGDGISEDEKKGENTDSPTGPTTTKTIQEVGKESSISTADITPSTSSDGKSMVEDGSKVEGQSSKDSAEEQKDGAGKVSEADKSTKDEATIRTGKGADEAVALESDVPIQDLTLDTISDDGLSWASDIDAPLDSLSESESASEAEGAITPPKPADGALAPTTEERWNAVCVFGLRVYSKGSQAEIEVFRKGDEGGGVGHDRLDVDDQAADATKKLQKRNTSEDEKLESAPTAVAWQEKSKQG